MTNDSVLAVRFVPPRVAGRGDRANGSGPKWPAR